jgi:hypothetical protein
LSFLISDTFQSGSPVRGTNRTCEPPVPRRAHTLSPPALLTDQCWRCATMLVAPALFQGNVNVRDPPLAMWRRGRDTISALSKVTHNSQCGHAALEFLATAEATSVLLLSRGRLGILLLPEQRHGQSVTTTSYSAPMALVPRCRERMVNHRPRCLSIGGESGVHDRCRLRAGIVRSRSATSVRRS